MRTKINVDPGTDLETQYTASQSEDSYAPTWKCKVSNILADEKNWDDSSGSLLKQAEE